MSLYFSKSKISFNNWHFLVFCLFVFYSTSQVFGKWNYNMNLNWFLIKEQTALVHLMPHSLKRFHGFQTWWTAEFRVRSEGCNHCSCSTVTQFTASGFTHHPSFSYCAVFIIPPPHLCSPRSTRACNFSRKINGNCIYVELVTVWSEEHVSIDTPVLSPRTIM